MKKKKICKNTIKKNIKYKKKKIKKIYMKRIKEKDNYTEVKQEK